MRSLSPQPTLVDQVYEAILSDITEGRFGSESRLIQEDIAAALGVSRQPVQQALLLLSRHGVLRDAPGRGLMVAPLDPAQVRDLYEIRGAMDGLAASLAARRSSSAAAEGKAPIERGRAAVKSGSFARMIAADMEFHFLLYRLSGNPLVAQVCAPHWTCLRRVMGEVLARAEAPRDIWDDHEAILEAVLAGDAERAGQLSRAHVNNASDALAESIAARPAPAAAAVPRTRRRAAAS
ncbi:MAG: GntR family transcriptional regulator [Rhodocyclaceae bacterium]|jgi:DNA-binding GntR family transcriptional regulator|nr:GntR family transcriptional regulator [Rhodocyclaceae bacterium]MCA3135246.1 GntR family transcriptional regulator [Rhodocyclaceae bacterium]MCA3141704.1 GntR family transcriptional regulator [Rhodocyclaceae bacterium]MCA3145278.1 GntR family transcriptional regulator [Rhodocyclaceae bacterium]